MICTIKAGPWYLHCSSTLIIMNCYNCENQIRIEDPDVDEFMEDLVDLVEMINQAHHRDGTDLYCRLGKWSIKIDPNNITLESFHSLQPIEIGWLNYGFESLVTLIDIYQKMETIDVSCNTGGALEWG